MFGEVNRPSDPTSEWEERKFLQQIVSLGVRYPYGNRLAASKAAISDTATLHRLISRTLRSQKHSAPTSMIREFQDHIQNEDDGYYLLDLHNGHIQAKGKHPVEDIIIDFTFLNTDDRILLRRRKGTRLHDTGFLVASDAVYFLETNRTCVPLKEFHMLSFIRLDGGSKAGFVVDYDAAQNDRPLVLFPCEENSGIIQEQLDNDDRCWNTEFESFIRNIGFDWKNI